MTAFQRTKSVALAIALTVSSLPRAYGAGTGDSSASLEECRADICGSKSIYLPPLAEGPIVNIVPLSVKEFIAREIEPIAKDIIAMNLQNARLEVAKLLELYPQMEKSSLTPEQTAILVVNLIATNMPPNAMGRDKEGNFTLNREAFQRGFPTANPEVLAPALNIFEAYIGTDAFGELQALRNFKYEIFESTIIKVLLSKNPAFQALKTDELWKLKVQADAKAAQDLQNAVGPFFFRDFPRDIFAKVLSGKALTDVDKRTYMRLILQVTAAKAIRSQEVNSAVLGSPLNLGAFLRLMKVQTNLQKVQTLLGSSEFADKLQQKTLKSVSEVINALLATSPSDLRFTKSMEMAEQVRAAAKKALALYAQGKALEDARKALDETRFMPPLPLNQVEDNMLIELRQISQRHSENLRLTQQIATSTDRLKSVKKTAATGDVSSSSSPTVGPDDLGAFLFSSRVPELLTLNAEKATLSLTEDFKRLAPTWFEDKTLFAINVVQISWQSLMFSDFGVGAIAHELGHVVSMLALKKAATDNNKGYREARMCSQQLHNLLKDGSKEEQFDEEDWADAFSLTVVDIVKAEQRKVTNYGCPLVALEERLVQRGLIPTLSVNQQNTSDPHSTGMFRALQIHVGLGGKLSNACRSLLGANISAFEKSCKAAMPW